MKAGIVAAALVGSAVASQHNRHQGFHMRRGEHAAEEVCTVYHTVYVTGLPPMAANSTMAVPPTAPQTSTTCTESSSVYVPGVPASTAGVPSPSTPAGVTSTAPGVPGVPASSAPPNYPAVPASSKPAVPVVSSSFAIPSYPVVDYSTPAVPAVPASSTSCTEEEHKPTPEAPKPTSSGPAYPAVPMSSSAPHPAVPVSTKPEVPAVPASSKPVVPEVPAPSKPVVPGVPASSTSCTEEEHKPTPEAPKPTPAAPKPTPEAPKSTAEAPKPTPEAPKPTPETPKPTTPAAPVAESSKPAYPAVPVVSSSAPAHPVVPISQLPSFTPAVPTTTSKPAAAKPTPSSSKPSGNTPSNAGSYGKTGRIVTNGDKWSMTYTPYASDGQCMAPDAIRADIKKIAGLGFTTIRIYATDCGVFEHVVPACQEHGLKVIYGVFLEAGGKGPFSDHANEQVQDIIEHAPKDSISMVIVGNEVLFNNICSAEQLGSYIDHVRNQFRSAGFPEDIAFTTAEPVGTWEEKGAALCSHIDVFAAQIHPFFTASIEACDAGDFVAQQLEQAAKVCPEAAANGKFVTETGWPHQGNANGKAVASQEQQNIAIKSIIEKIGSSVCILGMHDDGWKHPGEFGVEQFWGCAAALEAM
ncbi:Exo-beta-13-glucanase [Pyrenophora tritici-repentis]|nr:Exo-beta-13-glucanase [Pyrenophora tritici-repentis]